MRNSGRQAASDRSGRETPHVISRLTKVFRDSYIRRVTISAAATRSSSFNPALSCVWFTPAKAIALGVQIIRLEYQISENSTS